MLLIELCECDNIQRLTGAQIRQEARDGYDTIEWIGTQPWCNGSVALAGNSWLATTQWLVSTGRTLGKRD